MSVLEIKNISKSFGSTQVLRSIDFSLEKGEVIAIIGSSGSGKTTLLRCINFLEIPNSGSIAVNGETLFDAQDPETQKEKAAFRSCFPVFQPFPTVHCSAKCNACPSASGNRIS